MNASALETVGWLIVHSTWQFLLVGLVCWVVADCLLRQRSPSSRYTVFLLGILSVVICPAATLAWLVDHHPANQALFETSRIEEATSSMAQYALDADSDTMLDLGAYQANPVEPTVAALQTPKVQVESSFQESIAAVVQPWLRTIVVFWCGGVLVLAIRLLFGWIRVERIKQSRKDLLEPALVEAFDRALGKLQIRQRVHLFVSELIESPVVVGAIRSVILVPVNFASTMTPQHMEAILAHELAHVRRYDYMVNLFQSVIETLFFYHPAVWLVSHRMRTLREHCCDDIAVAAMKSPAVYGRALVAVEELRGSSPSLAVGVRDGDLVSRIRRLIGQSRQGDTMAPSGAIVAGMIATLSLVASIGVMSLRAEEPVEEAPSPSVFVANIDEQVSVELVAIKPHDGPLAKAWSPSGTKPSQLIVFAHSDHPAGFQIDETPAHDLLLRYRGLSDGESPIYRVDGARAHTWRTPYPDGEAFLIVTEREPSESASLTIGIPDPTWGPWRKVDTNGDDLEPVRIESRFQEAYQTMRPLDVKSRGTRSMLRWAQDTSDDDLAQFELVAIDDDGTRHSYWGRTFWSDSEDADRSAEIFDVPIEKIDRVEYRLRPIRHWVTFANISLRPEQKTNVDVSIRSVPIPELASDTAAIERPTPDPAAQRLGEQVHQRLAAVSELPAFSISTKIATSYYGNPDEIIGLKEERSLEHLKEALAIRKFDESLSDATETWAWRNSEVFATRRNVYTLKNKPYDQASVRTWDGQRGWYKDSGDQFGRYRSFGETFRNHYFRPTGYLYLGDHRFTWVDTKEYPTLFVSSTMPVEFANFQSLPDEVFAGEPCRVIRSIPRLEQFWIGKKSGRLIGCLRFSNMGRLQPLHQMASLGTIAGSTFQSEHEAQQWLENEATEVQKRQVSMDWAYLQQANQRPRGLVEFSDYREVAPGIELPHTEWHSNWLHEGERFKYYVVRTQVIDTDTVPDLSELDTQAFPVKGDTINDWRFSTHVMYKFDPDMPESEIHAMVDVASAKLRENQATVDRLLKPLREMVGQKAPNLAGEPLPRKELPEINTDGKTLLHFWAVWCGPCKNDVPILNKLAKNGLNVIGVHAPGTDASKVQQAIAEIGMEYPAFIGSETKGVGIQPDRIAGYPITMFPCSVMLDKDGNVETVGSLSEVLQSSD